MEKVRSELDVEPGRNTLINYTGGKRQCFEKIADIDCIDQYEIPTRPWSANSDLLPDATYISIEN